MKNIITDGGAIGNGTADDTAAIQAALNLGGNWYFPAGTYKVTSTLLLNKPATGLFGDNMSTTVINYTGTACAIQSGKFAVTLLWTRISDLRITAPNINIGYCLEMYSMQFSRITNVWLSGSNNVNCINLHLGANWGVTEATYNIIDGCYMGNAKNGIVLTDGANNNTISNTRIQPNLAGGNAILALGQNSGSVSCNSVISCGFEYPGNISNGIWLAQNTNGFFMYANRFEALNTGIFVGSSCVNTVDSGQYYSGCTNNKI